ncbi:unnamed protein product, partial [Amoebophrya sp. A120]|eukprot:GSA120T00002492001.1
MVFLLKSLVYRSTGTSWSALLASEFAKPKAELGIDITAGFLMDLHWLTSKLSLRAFLQDHDHEGSESSAGSDYENKDDFSPFEVFSQEFAESTTTFARAALNLWEEALTSVAEGPEEDDSDESREYAWRMQIERRR